VQSAVAFLIRHDRRDGFRFAPLQSEFAQSLLNRHNLDPPTSIQLSCLRIFSGPRNARSHRSQASAMVRQQGRRRLEDFRGRKASAVAPARSAFTALSRDGDIRICGVLGFGSDTVVLPNSDIAVARERGKALRAGATAEALRPRKSSRRRLPC